MTPEQFGLTWKEVILYAFIAGLVYAEFKRMRADFGRLRKDIADIKKDFKEDLQRLEHKVEKHNTFDRRIVRIEALLESKGDHNAQI